MNIRKQLNELKKTIKKSDWEDDLKLLSPDYTTTIDERDIETFVSDILQKINTYSQQLYGQVMSNSGEKSWAGRDLSTIQQSGGTASDKLSEHIKDLLYDMGDIAVTDLKQEMEE